MSQQNFWPELPNKPLTRKKKKGKKVAIIQWWCGFLIEPHWSTWSTYDSMEKANTAFKALSSKEISNIKFRLIDITGKVLAE